MAQLKVGVIGAGVFGGYHAGKVADYPDVELVGIFDPDMSRATVLADRVGAVPYQDINDLLRTCAAVVIATPATTHTALVSGALAAGCHTLVEKPLALTFGDAMALTLAAQARGLVLQVGHQERLVMAAMGLLDLPVRPRQVCIERCNPPSPTMRAGDVSVVWDLMIHDIDLVVQLLGAGATASVERTEQGLTGLAETVDVRLSWEGAEASLKASRLSDTPHRTLRLVFDTGDVKLDFISRTLENTAGIALPDEAAAPGDPLGEADHAFLAACLGLGISPVPARSVTETVRLAAEIDAAAR